MDGLLTAIAYFDATVSQWIIAWRTGWLTSLMRAITELGSTGGVVGVALGIIVICLYFRKRLEALTFGLTVLGAFLTSEWLKGVFKRARPPLPWLGSATNYSFPSGHSLVTLALYGSLAYLVVRNLKPSRLRSVMIAVLLLIPFLVGISRIYLGVHYPSDVLAGWILAVVWIGGSVFVMKAVRSRLSRK
ncbi:MAG TPA: phosphatase PAP2 family protein [Bacillota bacterium]|nr:phosphatase PAP2 family protein [Bacillota bacterium]